MLGKKSRKGRRAFSRSGERSAAGRRAAGVGRDTRIGRYLVRRGIGQGGMGAIFLAHDPVLGREVAIKVISLPADLGREQERQFRERFLREAQAAGSLVHPNIVAVHDIGLDPSRGSPYIVMEYVPGWDLRKVIEARAPLPGRTVVKVGLRIAAGLDFAHQRGIVHRDVKPANVLIGESGQVKITDFGVARLPGSELTRTDQFIGSPAFMAPEQLRGEAVDGRADLFALGVILYQLLTGRLPFDGDSVSEILYRIASQPAEPPSTVQKGLTRAFDPILERALSKNPAGRYQSGQEVMRALLSIPDEELQRGKKTHDPEAPLAPVVTRVASTTRTGGGAWWDLHSPRHLGGLAALLILVFFLLAWSVNALFRGPLRDLGTRSLHAATAGVPEPVTQGGEVELRLDHLLPAGRLVVEVDGETTLSEAIEPSPGEGAGDVSHRLSLPAGRHRVGVKLLDGEGALRAGSTIDATVDARRTARLLVQQRAGEPQELELNWVDPQAEETGSAPHRAKPTEGR